MKTLKDFQSKFCEDCTGACQGMCYGYTPAEDQFQDYKETEYLKDKEVSIWFTENDEFSGAIMFSANNGMIYMLTRSTFKEVYDGLYRFVRNSIDNE